MTAHAYALVRPELSNLLDEQLSLSALSELLDEPDGPALRAAQRVIRAPLADVCQSSGKEVRSRLLCRAYAVTQHARSPALSRLLPQLVEMLHAGSLVVDDIEDDADRRRGQPALHRVHGLPIALNAGNWLYFWPLSLLDQLGVSRDTELAMQREIAATLLRCHHGQALDLSVRVHDLSQAEVPAMVRLTTRLKTGSLLELSARLGALAADATPRAIDAIGRFARELGVILQTLDDLGCVLSPARRDKALEDLRGARPTWVWAFLAETLDEVSFRTLERGLAQAVPNRVESFLEQLRSQVDPSLKLRPRASLEAAIQELRMTVDASPALDALIRDARTLELSYE